MLTPHSEHNPAMVDPAEYPFRALLAGSDAAQPTCIMWFDRNPLPLEDAVVDTMTAVLANGGHVLLMTRCPDVLTRTYAAAVMIADTVLGAPAGLVQ